MNKLQKRVKSGEVIIRTTDKSKKICVCSYESYVRQGQVHIKDDREVGEEEIKVIQNKVNTTARTIVKIFRVGESGRGKNQERTLDAYSTTSCIIPPLSINPKDHKEGEKNGDPKSRPVCDGSSCQNSRLSDVLCEILTPVAKEMEGESEVESSEELLNVIEKINDETRRKIEKREGKESGEREGRRGSSERGRTITPLEEGEWREGHLRVGGPPPTQAAEK